MTTKIKKTPVKMFVVIAAFLFACGSGKQPPTLTIIQPEHTSTVTTPDTVSESSEANDDETAGVVTKTASESSGRTDNVAINNVSILHGLSEDEYFLYAIVEVPPVFDKEKERRNIEREFSLYVHERIVFPKEVVEKRITGRVYFEFFIDIDGTITDLNLRRVDVYSDNKSVGTLMADEVLRVLKDVPKWKTSGKDDGKPVKVFYFFMYHFRFDD